MNAILGSSSPWVFFWLTLGLMGFCAYITGQALAATWRTFWLAYPYAALLGLGDRFLNFALFKGQLLSLSGFLVDFGVLLAITLVAFRITRVSRMIDQYPWVYKRTSLWSYEEFRDGVGKSG